MPEKREERTTEGGLNVVGQHNRLVPYVSELANAGIRVSLFIEPEEADLEAAKALGAPVVELHTGQYCNAATLEEREMELNRIAHAAAKAEALGLECHAGHGLTYETVGPVAAIMTLKELNIGHFLIGEAIFEGLDTSIKHMRKLMDEARGEGGLL